VTTVAARAARRDLQIRAIAMMAAYEAGIAGTARECRSAEQLWPAVAATEELAYRTLESCWATERIGSAEAACSVGSTLFGPDGADRFAEALSELAAAIRDGSTPPELDDPPRFAAAELAALRDSLVH
jgi:hypothetical protein